MSKLLTLYSHPSVPLDEAQKTSQQTRNLPHNLDNQENEWYWY